MSDLFRETRLKNLIEETKRATTVEALRNIVIDVIYTVLEEGQEK